MDDRFRTAHDRSWTKACCGAGILPSPARGDAPTSAAGTAALAVCVQAGRIDVDNGIDSHVAVRCRGSGTKPAAKEKNFGYFLSNETLRPSSASPMK